MDTNNTNILIGARKATMRLAMGCLLLFFMVGSLMAQNPGPHVIKYNDTIWLNPEDHDLGFSSITYHYLAHVYNESSNTWVLQDATEFSPNCIWISDQRFLPSGTNKNYYFYDETNHPRFLAAPNFTAGGAIGISAATPTPTAADLNTPEYRYYFYKWDNGLGRGVQYFGVNETTCGHDWEYGECWEVYWIAYEEATETWKLSEQHYNLSETHDTEDPEPRGARYSHVVVTEHPQDTTTTSGGLADLSDFEMVYGTDPHPLSAPVTLDYQYSYTPEYTTYTIDEIIHNYYGGADHGTTPPGAQGGTGSSVISYRWTLSDGGDTYLSIDDPTAASITLSYDNANNTGDKTFTLTLTVTYNDGSKQHSTAEITVKTPCQNPGLLPNPVVTYTDVTVSWYPTATSYKVYWKKNDPNVTAWNSATVGNVTSYAITGLDFGTPYLYKVQATSCDMSFPQAQGSFTTKTEPEGMMIFGAIFGGGRMADVDGKSEVVIVNCDSIGAIYGGNDIAGRVVNAEGSLITLGVNDDGVSNSGYDDFYGTTNPAKLIKVSSVYGGGNGYYAYGSTSFDPIGVSETTATVGGGASVYALSKSGEWNVPVWTNPSTEDSSLIVPSITKTKIVVSNDYVKTDSIFGGAKNAFLTASTGKGSDITINGGTHMAVFGGNNVGGSQGAAKHYIEVNGTTTDLRPSIVNTATTGYGRDFGIRYLFGGGNKVLASGTDILIQGGQLDTIFAGGNSADVAAAQLRVACNLGAHTENTYIYGNTYTNAINNDNNQYTAGSFGNKAIDTVNYYFDGFTGIYNVRTLFGGNNQANMSVMPEVTLTSGSVGTVYGGGNAGDMLFQQTGGSIPFPSDPDINDLEFDYSTHVVLNSDAILVDYLYGGCQMSNVLYSTWVELQEGHVGTVYGGCNISGDVGSTRVNPGASYIPHSLDDQAVYGSTYVKAGGYTRTDNVIKNVVVYKNLFAGSNGYYNCSSDGIHYNNDTYYDDPTGKYEGLTLPTHNETHAVISDGARIRENVYAGGNLACVGFDDGQGTYCEPGAEPRNYPELVGEASVRMDGGRVEKNVYGGCNMSNIYGTNEVRVSGGYIGKALYGGNDRSGQVAEKTNRYLPDEYTHASDNYTSLTDLGVKTYVGVKGSPRIGTVYGGGNGAYEPGEVHYCSENFEPIQSYTFVDIHINGGADGGHIGTVYGGGNGVTVRHGVTVFLNVQSPDYTIAGNHVDTIFGGNNKGNLDVVSDILLVKGKVGTVYGGCNQGAMVAEGNNTKTIGSYGDIGSYVRLMETYDPDGVPAHLATVTAKVAEAIYGGCRMNGVTNNSLVLVEGGDFSGIPIFGGSDVSGHVSGISRVAVTGGTVGNVYGGGNGNYDYEGHNVYVAGSTHSEETLIATSDEDIIAPTCANSGVDILNGQVGTSGSGNSRSVFGGGLGANTSTMGNVEVNIGRATPASSTAIPTIYGNIYGGSALGSVNTDNTDITTVNFLNGILHGNVFGGGLGDADDANKGWVNGKVFVNISNETQSTDNCFIDLRDASVYGCNNTNGSPQDDVEVHVWKTGYTTGDYNSQSGTLYAINQVFGGGNQADYAPENGAANSQKKTLVYVHNCSNTIHRVFSGGNAAAATGVSARIEGGRFDYIFGGGNGEVDPANIGLGGTNLVVSGGEINHLFGGSNMRGAITGETYTEINGDNASCMEQHITEFFGGSNMAQINTDGSVYSVVKCGAGTIDEVYGGCNRAHIIGNVILDIKGGTIPYVYGGSKGVAGEGGAANITGKVTLNLEGGDITNAFGGSNVNGNITDTITVNIIDYEQQYCGLKLVNVYGGSNHANYTPTQATITSPIVNVMHIMDSIKGNVFGGGNEATVTANPKVNIGYVSSMSSFLPEDHPVLTSLTQFPHAFVKGNVFGGGNLAAIYGSNTINVHNGNIRHMLVGGGNNITTSGAGVSGNVVMNISGGKICTELTGVDAGVYGGCNTSGTVGGNIEINITSNYAPSADTTVIGTKAALIDAYNNNHLPICVHGGGYGEATAVNGNVTINYGSGGGGLGTDNDYPKLYGELYGGSALGTVNDDGDDVTTVNIVNGSIKYVDYTVNNVRIQTGGYIFGGGRGQEGESNVSKGQVNGVVHVNIGGGIGDDAYGKANLKGCYIFGGNNTNGSPQQDVYVDVYQTHHVVEDSVNYQNGHDFWNEYAIRNVYGGGNKAHYQPTVNVENRKKAHNTIHNCYNTIEYVYGGGNAANTIGTVVSVDGGRFKYIFGGGNGQVTPANIGDGGVNISIYGGHVGWYFNGCNLHGTISGGVVEQYGCPEGMTCPCEGQLLVDKYYFGANEAITVGGLSHIINCGDNMTFKYVYGGSRLAVVYGDIKLWVRGGEIENLFAGNEGSEEVRADVKKYPESDYDWTTNPEGHPQEVKEYLDAQHDLGNDLYGLGGNLQLVLEGGHLGKVYGGNDYRGNVEGDILIIVDSTQSSPCELYIDYLYGGNKLSGYTPDSLNHQVHLDPTHISPRVYLKNGTVNYDVFGGSEGGDATHPFGNGLVVCNPQVVIGNPSDAADKARVGRDVFGGGSSAVLEGNPIVVLQGKTTVVGNVFGGGKEGDIVGGTNVFIDPSTPYPTEATPIPPSHKLNITTCPTGAGTVTVTYNLDPEHVITVNSGDDVPEGTILEITVTPVGDHVFDEWWTDFGHVEQIHHTTTTCLMGSRDTELKARFVDCNRRDNNR